nr:ecdysone receptor-like [Leptinotarsa decemlineata]
MTTIHSITSHLGSMDIKHEMIYRDDDVLLVKSEPQLFTSNNGSITVSNLLSTSNFTTNTNNILVATTSNISSSNGLLLANNGLGNAGPFSGFNNSVVSVSQATKRQMTEDFMSSPSPGAISVSAPPLTPSPGPPSQPYTVISNGYSSPMSSGSYDPYSPNGKLEQHPDEDSSHLGAKSSDVKEAIFPSRKPETRRPGYINSGWRAQRTSPSPISPRNDLGPIFRVTHFPDGSHVSLTGSTLKTLDREAR